MVVKKGSDTVTRGSSLGTKVGTGEPQINNRNLLGLTMKIINSSKCRTGRVLRGHRGTNRVSFLVSKV